MQISLARLAWDKKNTLCISDLRQRHFFEDNISFQMARRWGELPLSLSPNCLPMRSGFQFLLLLRCCVWEQKVASRGEGDWLEGVLPWLGFGSEWQGSGLAASWPWAVGEEAPYIVIGTLFIGWSVFCTLDIWGSLREFSIQHTSWSALP